MSKGKTPGNLRDFRIDAQAKAEADSAQMAGRQQLRSRQSSVQEWGGESWPEWSNDAGADVDLAKPVSSRTSMTPALRPAAVMASQAPENEVPLKSENPRSMPWAIELALDERRMEVQGTVEFTNSYQKQELLKIRTREYIQAVQECFRQHVELFNDSRRSPSHSVHIYKVSKAEGDFMLFRNGVKLVVSGQRSGKIIFAFNQYLGQIFAPSQSPVVEIDATWGPFDQLFWSFKGERIQMLDLVRYFLTEFSKQSYR